MIIKTRLVDLIICLLLIILCCSYSDTLHRESMNPDALYVRGMCLYYQDNIEKAFQHFQQVLRLAPDHQKAKDIYRVSYSSCVLKLGYLFCQHFVLVEF